MVLMYHRVATPASDVWDIAVAPDRFEQHLQVLRKHYKVIPLQQLTASLRSGSVPNKGVAITFDDGYADNYQIAKPLLEKYELPATFFISSAHINQVKEFWWDELERLLLFTEQLPQQLALQVAGHQLEFNLEQETLLNPELQQRHSHWKASTPPVSLRSSLYLKLYTLLKPLLYLQQQHLLQQLKEWAGVKPDVRTAYKCMTLDQLKDMTSSGLLSVGIHTSTHPALASHTAYVQQKEVEGNQQFLEQTLNTRVNILAYPYGDHNEDSVAVAESLGLEAAFTTEAKPIRKNSHRYRLGRFQVQNWAADEFETKLKYWFNVAK